MNFHIVVLSGDGIGPEISEESKKVLNRVGEVFGHQFEYEHQDAGGIAIDKYDNPLPEHTLKACQNAQAVLKAPMGGPKWDKIENKKRPEAGILGLRKGLDLYANLRPVKLFNALKDASTLKREVIDGVDMLIVRELISGIYFGEPRGIEKLPDGQRRGFNTEQYTTSQVRRVARAAFELARTRKNKVCSVDKANVLETSVLWREEVTALHAEEFSDVELSHMYVDNAAMQIVRDPAQFDVMVTGNIFGDILSDCAAMASGSLGMLPSASLGPADRYGRRKALYEPVHGSAPDIAGRGIANPLGSIQSVIMMLRMTLDRPDDADLLEKAVDMALANGARTADIAEPGVRKLSTREMGDAVLAALDKVSSGVKEKA